MSTSGTARYTVPRLVSCGSEIVGAEDCDWFGITDVNVDPEIHQEDWVCPGCGYEHIEETDR